MIMIISELLFGILGAFFEKNLMPSLGFGV